DFGAGYVQRALPLLPRQGAGVPWVMSMDYQQDVAILREGAVAAACGPEPEPCSGLEEGSFKDA
ncbi:MAG TPA: hypothetical protein PKC93_02210, partial [Candidatus Obscuribacter sp.]|nr:hypothetical protein [Candidatus Obscuribacter sp.]